MHRGKSLERHTVPMVLALGFGHVPSRSLMQHSNSMAGFCHARCATLGVRAIAAPQ
jgi:hypothetical protein